MAEKMQRNFRSSLLTGASGGLGQALAQLVAGKKIPIMLSGRDAAALTQLSAGLRKLTQVETIACDLSTAAARLPLCSWIRRQAPDLVINNAGFGLYGEALSYTESEQLQILQVNAEAVLELTLVAARALVAAGECGTIINITSAAAFHPFPAMAVYAASKAFVNEFSYSLDCELAPYGVRVLYSCPGMIDTGFRSRASASSVSVSAAAVSPGEGEKGKKKDSPPFGSMVPAEVAQAIWRQLVDGEQEKIIDWRFRWASRLGRWLLPRRWTAALLQRSIHQRVGKRPLLLD